MLQSASKGKDLTEKQLIILGGSPDQQKEFLEQLNPEQDTSRARFNQRHRPRTVPVSNKYALGYTYHDVLDADHEDVLARMNVYMLSNPSSVFGPLLKPLLTARTVKDTLITILLDWSEPWKWARQLRQWIRLLRKVVLSLDEQTKIEMEESMTLWKEKRIGPDVQNLTADSKAGATTAVQLGPGEWDEELGVPLSVVCIQCEKIEKLEREQGWEEDHFDFLLQWVRTVLLKHGASLCYVASFDANDVRTLLHSSLNIQSLLKKSIAKHNVIDRDKILVPPNWDSWGKIRIMRDAFDVEGLAEKWSIEIQAAPERIIDFESKQADEASAVALFEASMPIQVEQPGSSQPKTPQITVVAPTLQNFLQEQQLLLQKLAEQDEQDLLNGQGRVYTTGSSGGTHDRAKPVKSQHVTEHRGRHSVNVGGIDVDAEEATRRLREREQERAAGRRDGTPKGVKTGDAASANPDTAVMKDFFAGLMQKNARGAQRSNPQSGVASPRRESPVSSTRTTDH